MKKMVVIGAAVLVPVLGAIAWWWQGSGQRVAVVKQVLPAPPAADTAPALRARLDAARARALSRLGARQGLGELSKLYQANGLFAEAMACDTGLERLAPNEPRWYHLHASILAGYGEVEPAITLWRRVTALAPDYVPARLRLGDCLLKSNQPEAAAAQYQEALKREPENPYALLGLARLDLEAQRWNAAREKLELVVAKTNYNLGYDLIVSLYERMGERARAEAIRGAAKASGAYRDPPDPWLDELIDQCFDPYRLSLEAGVAARFDHPDRAQQLLNRALEIDPANVSSHFQLGGLAEGQHNLTLAKEQFETCTQLAPEFADGWVHLSTVATAAGDAAAAERALADGLAHCPTSPGLHLMRAQRYRDAGRTDAAANEFMASIRLRPNEPDAYIELGLMWIKAGRADDGVKVLQQALTADPGEPRALEILAFFAISNRNETDARSWLRRIALQPRSSREQRERLIQAYREAFGHDWTPPAANE